MYDLGNSMIESVVDLSPKALIEDAISHKYEQSQFTKMFVEAGKAVANYERDQTEEGQLRRICFCEDNMKALAGEMYLVDDFRWKSVLDERLDELLSALEETNRKNCKAHFLQVLAGKIRKSRPEICERSMVADINEKVNCIYDIVRAQTNAVATKEMTRQHPRQSLANLEGPDWTLAHTDVQGIFGDKSNYSDDIVQLTEAWKKERGEYPGWYVLPIWKCEELDAKTREVGLLQRHTLVEMGTMFEFCYEFVWRSETSLHLYSHYELCHIQIIWNQYENHCKMSEAGQEQKWKYIGFALLRAYCEIQDRLSWQFVFDKLKRRTGQDRKERLLLQIEKLKSEYSNLDLAAVRRTLSQCKTQTEDFEVRLQILRFRVELNDSEGVLEDLMYLMRDITSALGDDTENWYLLSLRACSLQLLSLCVQGVSDYQNEYESKLDKINEIDQKIEENRVLFDWQQWKNSLAEALLKWHVREYEEKEPFHLNRESRLLIGGEYGCEAAYRFLRMLDLLALPLRCGYVTLLGDIEHPWMEAVLRLHSRMGVLLLCRCTKSAIIETIIDRRFVTLMPSKDADEVVDFLIHTLSNNIDEMDEFDNGPRGISEAIFANVPELLRRFSCRASKPQQERLLLLLRELMERDYLPPSFPMAQLCLDFSGQISEQIKVKMLNEMLQTKIVEHKSWHGYREAIDIFDCYFKKEDIGPLISNCCVDAAVVEELMSIPAEYGYEWKTKVARLHVLYENGFLSEAQKVAYAKLVWSFVSENTGLPMLDNLHMFAFDQLPCVDERIPAHSLKNWFLSQNLTLLFQDEDGCKGTMGYIPFLQELTLLCDKSEPGYWSEEEAECLLDKVLNYWSTLRRLWSKDFLHEMRWNEYNMRAIRMVETVAAVLRNVGSVSAEREEMLLQMAREMNTFEVSTKEIEIQISKDPDLVRRIISDMASEEHNITVGAITAAYEYIKAHPDNTVNAQSLLDELFRIIRYCKIPGLSSALYTVHNLLYVHSPIMSDVNIEVIDALLLSLSERLQLTPKARMNAKEVLRARKACVSVAFQIYKAKGENLGAGAWSWRRIAEAEEEINEVKNEWFVE